MTEMSTLSRWIRDARIVLAWVFILLTFFVLPDGRVRDEYRALIDEWVDKIRRVVDAHRPRKC